MRRRYNAWRRRQQSRIRYALMPGPRRITASGLRSSVTLVELWVPPAL